MTYAAIWRLSRGLIQRVLVYACTPLKISGCKFAVAIVWLIYKLYRVGIQIEHTFVFRF